MKKYLVVICKKHTKEVINWYEVMENSWVGAVNRVFDDNPSLDSNTVYGEAIEI